MVIVHDIMLFVPVSLQTSVVDTYHLYVHSRYNTVEGP